MRRKTLLIILLPLLLTGCKNEFESIFDDNNPEVITPILIAGDNESAPDGFFDDFSGFPQLAGSVMTKNRASEECAMIINDRSLLTDLVVSEDQTLRWPDIDFSKYSLILGRFSTPETGYNIARQRVVDKGDRLVLYLEVTRNEILQMFPATNYFGAIYPKLPDRAVEMNRWNNY